MKHLWRKTLLTAIGVSVSCAVAWLVIYPNVVAPQIGESNFSPMQVLSTMLIGFVVTFIVLGSTVRSAKEFLIMSIISGLLMQVGEIFTALALPYTSQRPFIAPLEFWTIGLVFSIGFSAFFMLIGLLFGWLARRFQKRDLQ